MAWLIPTTAFEMGHDTWGLGTGSHQPGWDTWYTQLSLQPDAIPQCGHLGVESPTAGLWWCNTHKAVTLPCQVSVVGRWPDDLKMSCPSPGLAGATCVLLGIGLRRHGNFSPPPTSTQHFGEGSWVTDPLEQPPISHTLSIIHGHTDALPSTPHAIKREDTLQHLCFLSP